jgi:hypothetical protein
MSGFAMAMHKAFHRDNRRNVIQNLRFVRLALSGALVGVAMSGMGAQLLGFGAHERVDVAGAGVGFAAVLAFKLLHLF